jgi:hypothetical protein
MMGMEMMLSKMIGMTPDQMAAKVKEFEAFIKGASQAMVETAETQKLILAKLEALENGGKQ